MSELDEKAGSQIDWIAQTNEPVLVTGAAGFVGSRVVRSLLNFGFTNIRCFVRPSSNLWLLKDAMGDKSESHCRILEGNLLAREDCRKAAKDATLIYHLVAGRGKSFPTCFQNSVLTTRNIVEASLESGALRRFVNVSSFAVYSNFQLRKGAVLDETCTRESDLEERYDAYVYGKVKQDEIVEEYHRTCGLPYVIVRPGIVFGPGKSAIPGTVGIDTFGIFLHLGGRGSVPLTYVDNCSDAIVLAGLAKGADGEVFNIVDDDLPSSRSFLKHYKKRVGKFRSLYVPYSAFYLFCSAWERYAKWSDGQLPPVFNRRQCAFSWKGHRYSNQKAKEILGWTPRVPMREALNSYFEYQRSPGGVA